MGFYKVECDNLKSFALEVRKGEKHQTSFKLENNEWVFDRSLSGEEIKGVETDYESLHFLRKMPYANNKHHEIYIVLDEFSVELFVDGKSITNLIYPEQSDDLLELKINADNVVIYKYLDK